MRVPSWALIALLPAAVAAAPLQGDDLSRAIDSTDAAQVKKLLDADPKLVLRTNARGWTLLHAAAAFRGVDIVKLVLDAKADVNARADDDSTPLHLAAGGGRKEVVALLLARGADVHAVTTPDRFTPLHRAAQRGNAAIVAMLLAKGAAVDGGWNAKSLNPAYTPLHFAVMEESIDVARLLLARGATVDARRSGFGTTPLSDAVARSNPALVKLLLRKGADPNQQTAFVSAVRSGKPELIQPFVARGVDFKADPDLLYAAAESGKKELVEMVLARGVDVNTPNRYRATALFVAARNGSTAIVRLLLAQGADANLADSQGSTPLLVASSREIGELLLKSGARIDAADKLGQTPLTAAVARGNKGLADLLEAKGGRHTVATLATLGRTEELRQLLKKEGLPKSKDPYRPSPLHLAAASGQLKAAQVLIDHGADVNAVLPSGETPLHSAAIHGHLALAELLVEHKARVNALMVHGFSTRSRVTPLWQALDYGHAEVVRFLAKAGGSPAIDGARNAGALLPLAFSKKHLTIVKLLFEVGAPLDTKLADNGTALHLAAEMGDLAMVKWLVGKKLGFDVPDGFGRTPLVRAVAAAKTAVIEFLLSQGAKVSDGKALFQAAANGDVPSVDLLLAKRAHGDAVSDDTQRAAVGCAARAGKLAVVRFLYARGASLRKDVGILHHAAFRGHREVVAYLLDKGVEVEQFRPDGFDLYYWAFQPKRLPLLAFFADKDPALLQKGLMRAVTIVEVNGDEPFGIIGGRPLQAAVAGKQKAVAALLLTRGASPKVLFPDGSSLLHLAVAQSDVEMVELLLKHGTPVNARNRQGQTALRVAVEREEEEAAALLRKRGARE